MLSTIYFSVLQGYVYLHRPVARLIYYQNGRWWTRKRTITKDNLTKDIAIHLLGYLLCWFISDVVHLHVFGAKIDEYIIWNIFYLPKHFEDNNLVYSLFAAATNNWRCGLVTPNKIWVARIANYYILTKEQYYKSIGIQ